MLMRSWKLGGVPDPTREGDILSAEGESVLPFPLFMPAEGGMTLPQDGSPGGNSPPSGTPASLVEAMRLALADVKGGRTGGTAAPLSPPGKDAVSLPLDMANNAIPEGELEALIPMPKGLPVEMSGLPVMDRVPAGESLISSSMAVNAVENALGFPFGKVADDLESLVDKKTLLPALETPVGRKGWGRAIGERLLFMVGHKVQAAEIRLNPPDLGPLEVRVSIQNDQANVSFTAHHAITREALEAAVPRLREMLGEQNLELVNVDVGQRHAQQGGGEDVSRNPGWQAGNEETAFEERAGGPQPAEGTVSHIEGQGLVDDYA